MEPIRLETARLAEVDDRHYYGASCSTCGHSARLSLQKLRHFLGGDFPLSKVRPRLRCEKCGGRRCVVAFLTPDRMLGSVVRLPGV